MKYRIGLDIGIGSIGWAVISAEEAGHPARIEDFGTRIFTSGENPKNSESLCKERRGFRSVRRLERRRSYRKKMLFNHLKNISFVNKTFFDDFNACRDDDIYALKVSGLDKKLSPAELYRCLIHTCNHRGYRDFYEPEEDDEVAGKNEIAANDFEKAFKESGKRTVSEYLMFSHPNDNFVKFRNRSNAGTYTLIRRQLFEEEVDMILNAQAKFYPCLTPLNIKRTHEIIFSQRDFEDGPGDPEDPNRHYRGFLETLGKCPFYQNLDRGFRGTVISDVFAVTNTLSQYRFVDIKTGEYELKPAIAKEIVDYLLNEGKLNITDVNTILKKYGYKLYKSEHSDDKALSKAVKYLGTIKKSIEEAGLVWEHVVSEEQFDVNHPSLLHKLGELLSTYQTPSRRKKELNNAGIDKKLIVAVSNKKISGTASASYAYMCDAIHAFLDGDIYGNFQANHNKETASINEEKRTRKLEPAQIDDPDVRNNRVVFKAINETRKIVNAIIDVYGSPEEIVVEVASELGKSYEMRQKEQKRQNENEKNNDTTKKEIAEMLSIEPNEVKGGMIERYKLFKEQEGKCAYSGEKLGELKSVVENKNKVFEVDHIIPYSLILDNTLENKMLVFAKENQLKGQRTPLMYMDEQKAKEFIKFVNYMYSRKANPISKKKLEYCKMQTLHGTDAENILNSWKSRNINDTRYITKYISGLFDRFLIFTGSKKQHVFPVKGSITSKFRKEWLCDSEWGQEKKDRSSYLNHAIDAVVAANLTKPYIEIGSDALRLKSIYKMHKSKVTPEYEDYLEKCISKMRKYYGFDEEYTRKLLSSPGKVPSFVPRLAREVKARFYEGSEEEFYSNIRTIYEHDSAFLVPPHMPITSQKQDKKFKGCIADSNPIKIVDIDGIPHKIIRKNIHDITEKNMGQIYSDDGHLKNAVSEILRGKGEKYSIGTYLKENGLSSFQMPNGDTVRKISLDSGVVSNYYRVEIGDGNYTNLGMLKYYCVEVYHDQKGRTSLCGIRFVDLVKKDKKLYRKVESIPENYGNHLMYLFANDFITVYNKNGEMKYEGYYQSVHNISTLRLYYKTPNSHEQKDANISSSDTIIKTYIDILGKRGGKIKCSEPLPFIEEKNSQLARTDL